MHKIQSAHFYGIFVPAQVTVFYFSPTTIRANQVEIIYHSTNGSKDLKSNFLLNDYEDDVSQ